MDYALSGLARGVSSIPQGVLPCANDLWLSAIVRKPLFGDSIVLSVKELFVLIKILNIFDYLF
jgi:hypothetical protein